MTMIAFFVAFVAILGISEGFHGGNGALRKRSFTLSMLVPVRSGSIVALVTPMTESNSIDYPKLESLLKWHIAEGTDGAVILGTTGEASTISMEERTKIITTSVKIVGGAFPIIVGTGTIETEKTIDLTRHAMQCGADASLIITPYYVKPPQRALVKHFLTIADAVALPLILYNCPGRTGVDLKPETIALMSNHPMIIGVKDATGDIERVVSIRKQSGDAFLIYSGEDDLACEFVRQGGDGVISVTANVAPSAVHKMILSSKEGRRKEAEDINDTLIPLHKRLFLESNPIPVKKALQIMGRIDSGIREPLCQLADEHLVSLKEALTIGKITF